MKTATQKEINAELEVRLVKRVDDILDAFEERITTPVAEITEGIEHAVKVNHENAEKVQMLETRLFNAEMRIFWLAISLIFSTIVLTWAIFK